jgi:MFS family permease
MRWRILALLFLARIGIGFQFQTLASVGDDLVVAFGLDYPGIGLLIGLFMAPGLFLAFPAGYWGRFVTDRTMVVGGLAALALGGLVSSMALDSWTVGLGRVFAGAGFLFTSLYFTKMIADWFEGREIATAMSILVMSWPFGIAMGQVGHAWLADAFGWRIPFQVASVYCLLAALSVFLFYKAPHDLPVVKNHTGSGLRRQEWYLVVCAASTWGVFNAGYVVYLSFAPKVLENLGQTALAAAGIISVGSWLMIFSGALCGQIADRFGRRDIILPVCMAGAIVSLLLLSVPSAGLAASLLFGLIGIAPAGVIMALAGEALRPEVRAFGMGIFFTVYYVFMVAIPPLAGAVMDATGSVKGPIGLAMILFASVVPLSIAFRYFKSGAFVASKGNV